MRLKILGYLVLAVFLVTAFLSGPAPAKDADIIDAAYSGDLKGVQSLLAKGADVNIQRKDGATALYMASWKGHTEVVRLLKEGLIYSHPAPRNCHSRCFNREGQRLKVENIKTLAFPLKDCGNDTKQARLLPCINVSQSELIRPSLRARG